MSYKLTYECNYKGKQLSNRYIYGSNIKDLLNDIINWNSCQSAYRYTPIALVSEDKPDHLEYASSYEVLNT